MIPTFKIIRYKDIVNKCFINFFSLYNDSFIKNLNTNEYILAENFSKTKIMDFFKTNIIFELENIVKQYNTKCYYFLVGDCIPNNDLFIQFINNKKLTKINNICKNNNLNKYFLVEYDINIDFTIFDNILDDIFISLFIQKNININNSIIIPIKHSKLGSAAIRDIILTYYRGNIIDPVYFNNKKCIILISDLIYSCIKNKTIFNTSTEFNKIKNEIINYLKEIFKI